MALSTAHTTTKADNPEKLFLLNKRLVKQTQCCGVWLDAEATQKSFSRSLVGKSRSFSDYFALALTLSFNGHFPGRPGLASTRMSPLRVLLVL